MLPAESDGQGVPALTVAEVAVRFGGVAALHDVSLTVEPGTVTGLIGPNGAGKTTLFNVVSGLQIPDRGSVYLFDADVTRMKPHRRARLGLARTFQRLELFGTLSASDNVRVGLEAGVRWQPWARWRGASAGGSTSPAATGWQQLLADVGLVGLGEEQSSTMSTGHARMVELARCLAIRPRLLLLDEPGSGLDEAESHALGALLVRLAAGGMAVLLVEHDMELVMRTCDQVYVLDYGSIIASGPPNAIREDPVVQAAYLGDVGPELRAATGTPGGAFGAPAPSAARPGQSGASTNGRDGPGE